MRQRQTGRDAMTHGEPLLTLCFVLILGFTLSGGCKEKKSGGQEAAKGGDRPVVVCTTTMIADIAQRIGQDRVHVVGIMKPGMDPHSYEATPNDVI